MVADVMPITYAQAIAPISQDRFHEIDFAVTGIAFDVQRDLGANFLDEGIYQAELAHRCSERGFRSVITEEPIVVSYESFRKEYYIDLLVDHSALFELKVATGFCPEHRSQALNYLLLTGLRHGKLINFSPRRVEHEFVSTRLTNERRYSFLVRKEFWRSTDEESCRFSELMERLLAEWGVFLDVGLFIEAVTHFLGGQDIVLRQIEVCHNSRQLGMQCVHLLNSSTAFKITAFTRGVEAREKDLRLWLSHTALRAIQWVNFNHHEVVSHTIHRD